MPLVVTDEHLSLLRTKPGAVIEDVELTGCTLDNCTIGDVRPRSDRLPVLRRASFTDGTLLNCEIRPAVFEDVVVTGARTGDLQLLWSPFFRRVTLRGRLGRFKINATPVGGIPDPAVIAQFAAARAAFYAETDGADWALDLTEARVLLFECTGVPLRRIRLDPDSQIGFLADAVPDDDELGAAFLSRYPETATRLAWMRDAAGPEHLLVAPLGSKPARYRDLVDGIAELRRRGLGLPAHTA